MAALKTSPIILRYTKIRDKLSQPDAALLKELPAFLQGLDVDRQRLVFRTWSLAASHLLEQPDMGALLYCQPDGSKSLLCRIGKLEVLIMPLRSVIVDKHYLGLLSRALGVDTRSFLKRFMALPVLNKKVVSLMKQELGRVGAVERQEQMPAETIRPAVADLDLLYAHYGTQRGDVNPYAMDIRLFRVLLGLREALCNLDVHVLVCDPNAKAHLGQLAKFYVYHTTEALPQRPPIFAARATADILQLFAKLPGKASLGADDSIIAKAIRRKDHFKHRGPIEFMPIEQRGGPAALLEISSARADPREVKLAQIAIQAALDKTDNMAVDSLLDQANLHTAEEVELFRQLIFLYQRGLAASGGRYKERKAWTEALECIWSRVATAFPGSVSAPNVERLREALELLRRIRFSEEDQPKHYALRLLKKLRAALEKSRPRYAV